MIEFGLHVPRPIQRALCPHTAPALAAPFGCRGPPPGRAHLDHLGEGRDGPKGADLEVGDEVGRAQAHALLQGLHGVWARTPEMQSPPCMQQDASTGTPATADPGLEAAAAQGPWQLPCGQTPTPIPAPTLTPLHCPTACTGRAWTRSVRGTRKRHSCRSGHSDARHTSRTLEHWSTPTCTQPEQALWLPRRRQQ